ncbi:lymphatic vessel endothelial hyaluronic receptor 1b [Toxotes jaculatrix]|uniref:lymphatic vessel endothelial hyaluronic receptor 1b n=1 Tax=Toxotes jaculatrix TaxID=941984 RepID=UPI001B3B0B3B|nr:lymphatic vessel endothelial hyaluronic receptor 1b [Toxotes jaculatrix]
MASFWVFTQFLLLCFAASFPAFESSVIKAAPQSQRVAGVFMVPEGGQYTLNFSAAIAACLFLNVTIATTDQMQRAVQQGLEMCKFGWVAEKIAVIPRRTSAKTCGDGKTGVVPWFAPAERQFGVFCFSGSDLEETQSTSKAAPQTSTSPSTPTTTLVKSTTTTAPSRKPMTTKSPEQTSFTSAFTLPVKIAHSTGISSTSTSLKSLSTRVPTSLSHLITSKAAVVALAFSTSEPALPQSVSSAKLSLGVAPMALIILGVIVLLLAAAGAVWYYKLNIFTFWSPGQQKDDTETEMWKHTDSETDLHSQHRAEDNDENEEPDRKYSSDIMLCVNPHIKRDSSE